MAFDIENWKTQIKKGYLELCLLILIKSHKRLYGLEIMEILKTFDLSVKEGTLYPMLNRMTVDGTLSSVWETEAAKGHPRKFYVLTKEGHRLIEEMKDEFDHMIRILKALEK